MINFKLRETQLKDGRVSLYLDNYPPIIKPRQVNQHEDNS